MNSYLQTLKSLKIGHSDSQVYYEASKYSNYQDFLHRRSKLRSPKTQTYIPQRRIKTHIQDNLQNYAQLKNKPQTVYYPVQRTQIQYHDRQYVEKIPKTRKVVEYIEKKEVEIVPREVKKTGYYAVQHLRTYYKQVVPQVRVQTIQVPKVIKNVQYVPVQKQIIFYPSYLTDMSQIKEQAKKNLASQGVIIREDAQYRPLHTKMNSVEINSNALSQQLKYKIEQAQQKLQKIQRMEKDQQIKQRYEPHFFTVARPKDHSKELRSSISNNTNKRVSWGSIPVYQKQRYENGVYKSHISGKIGSASTFYQPRDSAFDQKDLYRYDMVVNSSRKSRI